MKRCFCPPLSLTAVWHTILTSALLGLPLVASAQDSVRPFPKAALRGTLQVTSPPEVLLDGRAARLSPGARIRAPNNLLVLSGSLVGQKIVVNYIRDHQNMVHEVWLLNPTEARQPMADAIPATNYRSTYGTLPADTVVQPPK